MALRQLEANGVISLNLLRNSIGVLVPLDKVFPTPLPEAEPQVPDALATVQPQQSLQPSTISGQVSVSPTSSPADTPQPTQTALEAVSYTHLDVYKRQGWDKRIRRRKKSAPGSGIPPPWYGFSSWLFPLLSPHRATAPGAGARRAPWMNRRGMRSSRPAPVLRWDGLVAGRLHSVHELLRRQLAAAQLLEVLLDDGGLSLIHI